MNVEPKPPRHGGGGWTDGKRRPCRQCGAECRGQRRTFCSQECVDAHIVKTSSAGARRVVERRDRGVCAVCGFDTRTIRQRLGPPGRWIGWIGRAFAVRPDTPAEHAAFIAELIALGWTLRELHNRRSFWDADHIVAVVDGGGMCDATNLRTLCLPCHRRVTAELRRRIAEQRRA